MALNKERALERLQRSIDQIGDVSRNRRFSPVYTKWRRDTQVAIENTFGLGSRHIKDFDAVRYSPGSFSDSTPESYFDERFQKGLEEARVVLQSMIDEIKEYWDDETPSRTLMPSLAIPDVTTNKIFLVHGHDAGLKEQVARFLEKIGLEPIVLHEQPDAGRTIIEKFEQNADVPFAIAIFTPDDEGRRKGTQKFAPRARQNVLFEFGYFVGRLGRQRALALILGKLETPSDYDGVLYIPLDAEGAWKFRVVKELKAAGFDIDANLAT